MRYRLVRSICDAYAQGVLAVCIGLVALGFLLMFVFPPGSIVIVFVGLVVVGALVVLGKLMSVFKRFTARRALRRGLCPSCESEETWAEPADDEPWTCPACRAGFRRNGEEVPPAPAVAD